MILYDSNFLNDSEIEYVMSFWNENRVYEFRKEIIYFDGIELSKGYDFKSIKNGIINPSKFNSIRIQRYNEHIEQITKFHSHNDIHNYIIFLNDNFEGGELEFEDGILIKPKKGSIIYFCNNERHRVKNCIGDRFTLVLSGNNSIGLNEYSIRKRDGII